MDQIIGNFVNILNGYVWSTAMLVFVIGAGLYFSIRLRFTQMRNLKDMVRNLVSNKNSQEGISTFASFCTTMAARIGVGNIAGVAVAIYMGGPGAVFWMWVTALIIAATSFTECTLGQLYKVKIDGEYRGGAYYCAERGLGWKWFGILFAIVTIVVMAIGLPGIQANMIGEAFNHGIGAPYAVTGGIGAVILAVVILGGIKRISTVASILVPFMAVAYFILTAVLLIANASEIPAMFVWIFTAAFNQGSVFGGMIGGAIAWGVRRAVFASGSGMGEETPAAAAAETNHPVGQGLANSFGIYMDIVVVTCSALIILVTDTFNTASGYIGSGSPKMAELAASGQNGVVFPQEAVGTLIPGAGEIIIGFIVVLFAFTSVISYAYQAETALAYLFGNKNEKVRKGVLLACKLLVVLTYFYFSTTSSTSAWAVADLGVGMMVWLNVFMILFLFPKVVVLLKDYEAQRKLGKLPFFDPDKVGIKNVDLWKEINKEQIAAANAEQES